MITEKIGDKGEKVKISVESGHPVEWTSEENYMFKLTKYLPEVKRWIEKCNCEIKMKSKYLLET
jgi:methionyl-tRNA synthetase